MLDLARQLGLIGDDDSLTTLGSGAVGAGLGAIGGAGLAGLGKLLARRGKNSVAPLMMMLDDADAGGGLFREPPVEELLQVAKQGADVPVADDVAELAAEEPARQSLAELFGQQQAAKTVAAPVERAVTSETVRDFISVEKMLGKPPSESFKTLSLDPRIRAMPANERDKLLMEAADLLSGNQLPASMPRDDILDEISNVLAGAGQQQPAYGIEQRFRQNPGFRERFRPNQPR